MSRENSLDTLLEILKLMVVLEKDPSYGQDLSDENEGWTEDCASDCKCCNPDPTVGKFGGRDV